MYIQSKMNLPEAKEFQSAYLLGVFFSLLIGSALFVLPSVTDQAIAYGESLPPVHTKVFLSEVLSMSTTDSSTDKEYIHLDVPIPLAQNGERIWITGVFIEAVDQYGRMKLDQGAIYQAQLQFGSNESNDENSTVLFGGDYRLPSKWFIANQTQLDIAFPKGFGFPTLASDTLHMKSMVYNGFPIIEPMRVRTTVQFVYDNELATPLKALSIASIEAGEGQGYYDWIAYSGHNTYRKSFLGREMFPHDTTIYNIATYAYEDFSGNLGKYVELWDKTDNMLIYKSSDSPDVEEHFAKNISHNTLLDLKGHFPHDITQWESDVGIQVYTDHEYELVAYYSNVTAFNVDAGVTMYYYFEDKSFVVAGK